MTKRIERLVPLRGGVGGAAPARRAAPAEEKPFLSQEEAARRLGIGVAALRSLIADGTIFAITVGASGSHKRIPVAEIEKWKTGAYHAAGLQDHRDRQ